MLWSVNLALIKQRIWLQPTARDGTCHVHAKYTLSITQAKKHMRTSSDLQQPGICLSRGLILTYMVVLAEKNVIYSRLLELPTGLIVTFNVH